MSHTDGVNGAVASILREARLAAGLTLEEVARRAGIPHVSTQRFLSAKRAMNLNTFEALCRAMGLSPAKVLEAAMRADVNPDLVERVLRGSRRGKVPKMPNS